MDGEVFFHVRKTPLKSRFIVHREHFDIIVTGTQFNVSNRHGKDNVLLQEGSNKYSVVNRYTFSRLEAPTFFLTCGETELLLAEAAVRGWISGDPGGHYTAGVRSAMQQLGSQAGAGPADAVIDEWLASHSYDASRGLQQINEQYWVAGFMDENECFANWRRSNYPTLISVNYPGNITGGNIPRRFTYPQSEASTNSAHYNAAVARLASGDRMTSRVWWDK